MASMKPFRCCGRELCGNEPGGILSIRRAQVRSFPAVITGVTVDPRHISEGGRGGGEGGGAGGYARGAGQGREVGIFHLFSKADPLSNLCGLRLLDRLIHYGWFSLDCIWLNYERHRGGAKSKGTRFELLKYLFCLINRDPSTDFLAEEEGRREGARAQPRDRDRLWLGPSESRLVADSRYFENATRLMHNRPRDVRFY